MVNVEASNDYGDYSGFYREVHRVLRPDGVFLYCDTCPSEEVAASENMMRDAGFDAEFRDITDNVAEACRADSPRRLAVIRNRTPWLYAMLFAREVRQYAGVVGSRKFEEFRSGRRVYFMARAVKSAGKGLP